MLKILRRESIYLWYYFELQLRQILPYWLLGILIGSVISVFAGDRIHRMVRSLGEKKLGLLGVVPASVSSILLNPQLIIYSTALGAAALTVRLVSCFFCGVAAGLLIRFCYRNKPFFDFSGFEERKSRDVHPNPLIRLLKNIGRNFKATGPWFLLGVVLSVLFQRYVPAQAFSRLFGENEGFGVLMAATVGVPLYACGGGTIPLLQQWLWNGMSMGSAAAFMITGPATKITNLGALKIVLGIRRFALYLVFVILFSLLTGLFVDLVCF